MEVSESGLEGLRVIDLKVHGDERGFFVERFNKKAFEAKGLSMEFVQDNHSRSAPGVLRGLHYQVTPAQGKLIGVSRGKIWDVVVDLRKNSTSFGKHFSIELSDMNGRLLWIPQGFAHGFCVLGDQSADVIYKVDSYYTPSTEGGVRWSDVDLAIPWPIVDPIVSARDQALPLFSQITSPF
jgi:dTDP-4-dehydrorhamnose 3,5-epimerase